jgi:hypothetical protein
MTLDISASNNNGRLLWKLSLNNNYDINNMQCETQRIFKMRTSRLVPPTIKELLCFRLHKSQHSSPFSLVQHKNWEFSEAGKICIILYHIPMSPPLNKYKNNPEKQTRAAINILPYIRNNALYLLFGSIYITLTFILLHQLKQGKKCK